MDDETPDPEARVHPRYELCASVVLKQDDAVLSLTVRNISLGGAFLAIDAHQQVKSFPVGSKHKLIIFDPDDLLKQTAVTAEIVRHDSAGMGISWCGEPARARIALLLEQLIPA